MLARVSGSGLPLLVAQVFNPCVFRVRIGLAPHRLHVRFRKGEQPDRRHAQKPVRRVPRGGRSGAFEQRTHTSRRRRACRRPAAVALQRASVKCDPYKSPGVNRSPGWTRRTDGFPRFAKDIDIFFSDAAENLRGRRCPRLPAHRPSSVIDPRPDVGGEGCQTGQLSAALRSPSTLRSISTEAGQAAVMSCAA